MINGASYAGFDDLGVYRIVIFAQDNQLLLAQPVVVQVVTGSKAFLPLVVR